MTTLLIILWLIFGILSVMNLHYTFVKNWYILFNEHPNEFNNGNAEKERLSLLMVLIPYGLISFILVTIMLLSDKNFKKNFTYYFKIPKNEKSNK